jgi:hypothetical protein
MVSNDRRLEIVPIVLADFSHFNNTITLSVELGQILVLIIIFKIDSIDS